ncbi:MAG: thioredoxin-disulfide reductase [Peptoniphilaceae bacterium]|nr:thioredoxin-disulfide reductase [Peptoniphilaceae bacterium]
MYDLIIIGAGPAGLSAALYAGRGKLKTLVVEKTNVGGQLSLTNEIDNYPGSIENADGFSLSERMKEQAEKFEAEIIYEEVVSIDFKNEIKEIKTEKNIYKSKVVIIATGASPKKLGVTGEDEFFGKGVSYCATCDAPFFKDLDVYIQGGGETALTEAAYISKFAKHVYVVHRRDSFRASKSSIQNCNILNNISYIYNSSIIEVSGEKFLNKIKIKNLLTGEITNVEDKKDGLGLFIFVGNIPKTKIYEGLLKMKNGYICTDDDMKTNIKGVFAVGDVRDKKYRQVVTAVSDGAISAMAAEEYLQENKR